MATYIGYIVGKNESNPFSVFIPARSGIVALNSSDGFGINAGKWGLDVLAKMLQASEKCYLTTEPGSNVGDYFDDVNGYTTVEENMSVLNSDTAKDVTSNNKARNTSSSPLDEYYLRSPFFRPAANLTRGYVPSSLNGMKMESFTNAPGGKYTTLRIGSKVLVEFPDGSGVGYIIKQLPSSDKFSQAIKSLIS